MTQKSLKLVSWNVNGLRAVMKKDFLKSFGRLNADVFAIQETKLQEHQLTDDMRNIPGYTTFWSHAAEKKGYSGVGVYTQRTPQRVNVLLDRPEFDTEGRMIEIDLDDIVFFNVYFPNGQMNEERLKYKLDFYDTFFEYTDRLKKEGRSLVITGDFNTAHNEIDLKNPRANENTSGFLRIERDWLDRITERGYIDTFRHLHPDTVKYSWWTYRFKARERGIGWRIDYFFVSRDLVDKGQVKEAFIANDVYGSDHCPVGLILEI
jgi:exodeoxyribonuclease-3